MKKEYGGEKILVEGREGRLEEKENKGEMRGKKVGEQKKVKDGSVVEKSRKEGRG